MSPSDPIIEFPVKDAWVSGNSIRNQHWVHSHRRAKQIRESVKMYALTLPLEEQRRVLLTEPEKRRVDFTIVGTTSIIPDVDNMVAGLKFLIDALRRCYLVRTPVPGGKRKYTVEKRQDGPGFIWDDDQDHFELGSVKWENQKTYPTRSRYVVVSVRSPST